MTSRISTTVSRAAEVILGRQRNPQSNTGPHMVPYLRAANVTDGALDLSDVKAMNFAPSEQKIFALRPGDVLVSEGSGSLRTIGASAVWNGEIHGGICFQNTLLRLRPRSSTTDPRFLAWWARAAFANGLFASIAAGANIYHLSAERVRSLPIELPSLEDQRQIADFLDGEAALLEAVESRRTRQIDLLRELAAARISRTFAVGPDTPPVRLGYLARIQTGITIDATRSAGDEAVTRPYLRVANVQAGYLDLSNVAETTAPRRLATASTLRPGDVLMTEGGDLDKLGRGTVWEGQIADCLHQNHVFAVRVDTRRLVPNYLALFTQTVTARAHFEGSGIKTTNLASTSSSKIRDLRIPLPSIAKQTVVVAEVTSDLRAIEALGASIRQQCSVLAERRQALITAAVTGQFDVTTGRGADPP